MRATRSATSARRATASSSLGKREIHAGDRKAASICAPGVGKELRKSVTVTSGGRSTRWVKADLVAMQIVDAAAKGDLKAAVLAMRLDDELGALAVSSSAVAAIPRLDKDALKRIAARAQRLAEDA